MADRFAYLGAAMIFGGLAWRTMRWVARTSRELEEPDEDRSRGGPFQWRVHREEFLMPGPGAEAPPCPGCGEALALRREGGKAAPFRCRHCGLRIDVSLDGG